MPKTIWCSEQRAQAGGARRASCRRWLPSWALEDWEAFGQREKVKKKFQTEGKARAKAERTPARLHHQLLPPPEALLAPATYRPVTYQSLYSGASSHLGIPRTRPAPYPLPNIRADRDQGGLPLPAGLGLLSPTVVCLGPGQDSQ
ncbi:hypothetical protein H8959_002693 [Pygathrix nigripes]